MWSSSHLRCLDLWVTQRWDVNKIFVKLNWIERPPSWIWRSHRLSEMDINWNLYSENVLKTDSIFFFGSSLYLYRFRHYTCNTSAIKDVSWMLCVVLGLVGGMYVCFTVHINMCLGLHASIVWRQFLNFYWFNGYVSQNPCFQIDLALWFLTAWRPVGIKAVFTLQMWVQIPWVKVSSSREKWQ